jgi:hypothetical protein
LNLGNTDTADTTCLHVPSIELVDAVYNGIHPYLAETDKRTRLEWIAALDQIESLNPRADTEFPTAITTPSTSKRRDNTYRFHSTG